MERIDAKFSPQMWVSIPIVRWTESPPAGSDVEVEPEGEGEVLTVSVVWGNPAGM